MRNSSVPEFLAQLAHRLVTIDERRLTTRDGIHSPPKFRALILREVFASA
jgi:hypothetical protein